MKPRNLLRFITIALCLVILSDIPQKATGSGRAATSKTGSVAPPFQSTPTPQIASESIEFDRISGLSNNIVQAIYQDHLGFMWFGTENGLSMYDGYNFTEFHYNPEDTHSLSANGVVGVFEDSKGVLWVSTDEGINRLNREVNPYNFSSFPFKIGQLDMGNPKVLSFYEDKTGTLWVGTTDGIFHFDHENEQFLGWDNTQPTSPILDIHEDLNGDLWLGTESGIIRTNLETDKRYSHDPEDPTTLSDNMVTSVFEDHQGELWIGTSVGLNKLDRETETFTRYQHDPEDAFSLSQDTIIKIQEDSAGRLWVGTLNGLNLMDREEGRFYHYLHDPDDPRSMSHNVILTMYVDRSGVLWVGTVNGINRLDPTAGRFKLTQQGKGDYDGLSDNVVFSLFEDHNGTLWAGTFSGGLNRLDRGSESFTNYRYDPADPGSLGSDYVSAIYEDQKGILWVATPIGLDQFDPQREMFQHMGSFGGYPVNTISGDQSGGLWIGTENGLYRRRESGSQNSIVWTKGLNVYSHYTDKEGILWMGTVGDGIYLSDDAGREIKHFQYDPEDPGSFRGWFATSFYEAPTLGLVWIGTWGDGLYRYDRATQSFSRYTVEDGLPSDAITCILADSAGFMWLGTGKGISRFDPRTEEFKNYDHLDGLQSGEFFECHQGEGGKMYFGGTQGLNSFYPHLVEDNPDPPPVVITAFNKFNQTVRTNLPAGEHIQLEYNDNFISFEFAALNYTKSEKNQYAYMMEGLDSDWNYAGTRRFAEYPSLEPGEYTFRVKASNNDGVWNEEGAAVRVTIQPPFWGTLWFQGLMVLLLTGVVFSGYRLQVRRLEARGRELEAQVVERTQEIERRRQVAEGLRDILAVLNSNLPRDEILDYLVTQASRLLGAGGTILHQIEREEERLTILARYGLPGELAGVDTIPFEVSRADEAILSRKPQVIHDLDQEEVEDPDLAGDDPQARRWLEITRKEFTSFLAIPLIVEDQVRHCLACYYPKAQTFSEEEIDLAVALADQAALAIENALLRTQVEQAAVVEERNRLARDLHDSVTQSLFGVTLYADAASRMLSSGQVDTAAENLGKLRKTAKDALGEMRLLIYELRPAILEQEGLVAALESRLEAVEGRIGLDTQFSKEGEGQLPPEIEAELYRIAQEALNNVLKHARAGSVEVALKIDPQMVTLEVTDDGVGFDIDTGRESGGLGLRGMQERVEKIGGKLTVKSTPGGGTSITVQVEVTNE
jgi:signal transduction histidine kinase/ligand-binding sensor domain-containing protein